MTGSSIALGASALDVLGISGAPPNLVSPPRRENRSHGVRSPNTSGLPTDPRVGLVDAERAGTHRAHQVAAQLGVARFDATDRVSNARGDGGAGAFRIGSHTPRTAAQSIRRGELFQERVAL